MNRFITGLCFLLAVITTGCNASKEASATRDLKFIDPNTYQLYDVAKDAKYAYTVDIPVKVGGFYENEGVLSERRYLNALLGPDGEKVTYKNIGNCCFERVRSKEGKMITKMITKYELTYEGSQRRFVIFISPFEQDEMKAPKGFTFRLK